VWLPEIGGYKYGNQLPTPRVMLKQSMRQTERFSYLCVKG